MAQTQEDPAKRADQILEEATRRHNAAAEADRARSADLDRRIAVAEAQIRQITKDNCAGTLLPTMQQWAEQMEAAHKAGDTVTEQQYRARLRKNLDQFHQFQSNIDKAPIGTIKDVQCPALIVGANTEQQGKENSMLAMASAAAHPAVKVAMDASSLPVALSNKPKTAVAMKAA